jgi:hypothetical protein
MTKSYRIKSTPGKKERSIRINVTQDFDFLEILSLKLRQEDVYARFCADYGVVAGRVIVNGGYGVPNANVSIFIPLDAIDENDPVISTLYPYKNVEQKNEDGYRYNLLPYVKEYDGHTATGTFPDKNDVLTRTEVLEVYEKYYKFTVKTNESGDFMIIGAPLGIQTLILDLDLSNIGCFSLRPADLIRAGLATTEQFDGDQFKSSTDLNSLPQIVNIKQDVDVTSFWGETELCNVGITRADFDLRDFGIDIKPHAVFMGSIFSSADEDYLKTNCKPGKETGNLCSLVTAPGRILAVRQTINYDNDGRPVLEQYTLPEGGKVIDDNGTWLIEVPMNLDYVTTNEFGEQVLSNDPSVGIPTKGKYRFRIQYQNEAGMENSIMRGDYLVPNVKEWGWASNNNDEPTDTDAQLYSYAFSLDWTEYGDPTTTIGQQMIQEAIDCEDRFYQFNYNKVYTISGLVDRWKWGSNRLRHLGIKDITDRTCVNTVNKFPVNDGVRNFDFLVFILNLLVTILTPVFVSLIIILHVLALLYPVIRIIINLIIWIINVVIYGICLIIAAISTKKKKEDCKQENITPLDKENPFKRISLPMMSYPDCEACPCEDVALPPDESAFQQSATITISASNFSPLADLNSISSFETYNSSYASTSSNPESYNNAIRQAYAGYQAQNSGNNLDKLLKVPLTQFLVQGGIPSIGYDVHLAQSMNLANVRQRYFDGLNHIKVTVNNTNPLTNAVDPSTTFDDSVLVMLCDSGTISNMPPGQLLTFTDLSTINDPNTTGLTTINQFNTNNITGSTPYSPNSLYNKQFSWVDTNGNVQSGTLKLKITENGKEYKFKAGVEYFQLITGATTQQFSGITSGTTGLLNQYLFRKTQTYNYGLPPLINHNDYITPWKFLDGFLDMEILILSRGVDPYTEKQKIKYDLSKLFGYALSNGPTVEGIYHLNIPIQPNSGPQSFGQGMYPWYSSYVTPQTHKVTDNTTTSPYNGANLYFEPYGFTVDPTQFTSFTNNSVYYYNSTDKSQTTHKSFNGDSYNLGHYSNNGGAISNNTVNNFTFQYNYITNAFIGQGNFEGGTLLTSSIPAGTPFDPIANPNSQARLMSPAYHLQLNANVTITNNNRMVLRSDRLPTSTKTQTSGNTSYSLHLNDNFAVYLVGEDGNGTVAPFVSLQPTDTTNNLADLTGDTSNAITDAVIGSLQCENLTLLECYSGTGTSFGVNDPCDGNLDNKRVSGGCYYFVDKPLIISIPKDIKYFIEWKARFRMMFGACRGVFSQVFQNNWVNGSLYMFSFKKKTIFSITGQPKKYQFCGSYDSLFRPGQGPVFYAEGKTNGLYYRATPYTGSQFVGQVPKRKLAPLTPFIPAGYGGMNERNLYFPTTIMDLGPRDQFTKEICANPQFEGYLMETFQSTSFNDTSDLLQLFIISRLINSNFLGQMLGIGDASINRMFSRSEDRIDGDIAQLFSINSEYGVEGFSDDVYDDDTLYVAGSGDALVGVFFTGSTENRIKLTPGITTFTPTLTNYFGYPKTQEVPFYLWKLANTNTIFGSDENEWQTGLQGLGFYKQKYQTMSFYQAPFSNYFNTTNYGKKGYIYNTNSNGNTATFPPGQNDKFVVGAPYHFYFGLFKGKSVMNRYITKYIFNQDV